MPRRFVRTRALLSGAWHSFRAEMGGVGLSPLDALDDRYFSHLGYRTAAGTYVSPGSAQRLAAVYSCVRVCAETTGSLPTGIYKWRSDGGKERADQHPLASVLRKPNMRQTRFDFWQMIQGHLELRGNAYAEIVEGNEMTGKFRPVDQLIPLHPDRVTVYLLPNGRLRYEVRNYYGSSQTRSIPQEYMLHFRQRSEDGIMGVSTVTAMAEVIGKGLAQQQHGSRYFSNHAIPGLAIETVKMSPEARQQMVESISEGFSGPNAFKVFAPPSGATIKSLGLTNADSQLIESMGATRTEICGAWRVPPHKVGDLSRGTFSNIEQQNIEFATDCIRPRVEALEARINIDLIDPVSEGIGGEPGEYFIVFNMDALYRGDLKSRYEAYAQALPWMKRNEMRTTEGLNADPNPACNELLVPVAYETVTQAQKRSDAKIAMANAKVNAKSNPDKDEEDDALENVNDSGGGGGESTPSADPEEAEARNRTAEMRARAIATQSAARIVRREAKLLRKMAKASNSIDAQQLEDFYTDFINIVSEQLPMSKESAKSYCAKNLETVAAAKPSDLDHVIDSIEEDSPASLASIALGERLEQKKLLLN